MSNSYKLSVNQTTTFEWTESDLKKLDAIQLNTSQFHVLDNHKPYKVEIVSTDFIAKKYTIKVNNNTYEVAISDALDILIQSMGIERGRTKVVNAIKAPMPGMVLSVKATVGSSVNKGDILVVLEAMKMENAIKSPGAGVVKSILIEKGMAVDKNQVLIEFEV